VQRFSLLGARRALGSFIRHEQIVLAAVAVCLGLLGGGGAVVFREAIDFVQLGFFGTASERLASHLVQLPWWRIPAATVGGGLIVGLIVYWVMPNRRTQGVADVIESSALLGGKMDLRAGIGAAVVSAISLGAGASTGREGPVVHLGATLSAFVAERLKLGRAFAQTLLGCGVAAGVAASFNAPIAGAIFALEVVVRSYALAAFAPIIIAAVTGTIFSRIYFGDFPAFTIPSHEIVSFFEFPAFALLGVFSAFVAISMTWSVGVVQAAMDRTKAPLWLRPALGGILLAGIALYFPQVLGVGYEATDQALNERLGLWLLIALVVAKTAATAITLGSGFGGGVFSPSLFLGAMLGGAFGMIATDFFPHLSSGHGAYTIVGMGAVAGAVLGAPLSTILIVFELTGDYALTIAVMIATVIASQVASQSFATSFFLWQLKRRGISLKRNRVVAGPSRTTVGGIARSDYPTIEPDATLPALRAALQAAPDGTLFVVDADGSLLGTVILSDLADRAFDASRDNGLRVRDVQQSDPPTLLSSDTLDMAVDLMDGEQKDHVAVLDETGERIVGILHLRDVLRLYHKADKAKQMAGSEDGEHRPGGPVNSQD